MCTLPSDYVPPESAVRQTQLDHFESEKELRDAGRFRLAYEVVILREQRDRADRVAMEETQKSRMRMEPADLKFKQAFLLMTYVSQGGHLSMRIWNSRDGMAPFKITVDNITYEHDASKDSGLHFDRPEGCEAQWETRTVRGMMDAWGRSLDRAVLLGRLDPKKAEVARTDATQAKGFGLHVGLRSLETGKYTDEL